MSPHSLAQISPRKSSCEVARTVALLAQLLAQLLARSRCSLSCSHSCSHGRAARTVACTVAPLAQLLAQLPCACGRTLRLRAEGLSIGLLAQLLAQLRAQRVQLRARALSSREKLRASKHPFTVHVTRVRPAESARQDASGSCKTDFRTLSSSSPA